VDTYLAWVMVKAERNAPDDILAALKQGAYYASCGPAIEDLKVEPAERAGSKTVRLSVRTSPAAHIAFVSDVGGGYAGACGGDGAKEVSSAEYVAHPGARYVRVEVTDARGRKAWTNPVPVAPPKPGGGSPATVAGIPLVAPWARI
jgi:hypothetical protein